MHMKNNTESKTVKPEMKKKHLKVIKGKCAFWKMFYSFYSFLWRHKILLQTVSEAANIFFASISLIIDLS